MCKWLYKRVALEVLHDTPQGQSATPSKGHQAQTSKQLAFGSIKGVCACVSGSNFSNNCLHNEIVVYITPAGFGSECMEQRYIA